MSYEIPQQLQYEEKIVFGLTFRQMVYAIIFGIPALIIFFKTKWPIVIKGIIATILIGISCLFMFFNLKSYLNNMLIWLKFREISAMDLKMIQFIGIKKIQNGVVYIEVSKKPNA